VRKIWQGSICLAAVVLISGWIWMHANPNQEGGVAHLSTGANAAAEPSGGSKEKLVDRGGDTLSEISGMAPNFQDRVQARRVINQYQLAAFAFESQRNPSAIRPVPTRQADEKFLQLLKFEPGAMALHYRRSLEDSVRPSAHFRAPILDRAQEFLRPELPVTGFSAEQLKMAGQMERDLPHKGLIQVLAEVMAELGPDQFRKNPDGGLRQLRALGFPVDLLRHFKLEGSGSDAGEATQVAVRVAEIVSQGKEQAELGTIRFLFRKAHPQFRLALENGTEEIGLLRMQAGGGFDQGLVRGESVDLIGQMVAALPEANSLVTIPEEFLEPFVWLATHCWPLERPGQLTIISDPFLISPWAQDNGKAGWLETERGDRISWATLTPRYASQGELISNFKPAESFLMDGVNAADVEVVHSDLMFQGGNVLGVEHPQTGRRILFLGEAEIHRNQVMGLTREQVLEAFRIEFDMDESMVLPTASYHLDFDISIRAQDGKQFVLVNDIDAAVNLMVASGIEALARSGFLTELEALNARGFLERNESDSLLRLLNPVLYGKSTHGDRKIAPGLADAFAWEETDYPAENLKCFLVALHLLQSDLREAVSMRGEATFNEYFAALREIRSVTEVQKEFLEKMGFELVLMPSFPDMARSINYINGIHDPDRFIMPVFKGFFSKLDQAAKEAVRKAFGERVAVVPIYSAAMQQKHGGVHCSVSVFPRLNPGVKPPFPSALRNGNTLRPEAG
jgi:hypothetical protein